MKTTLLLAFVTLAPSALVAQTIVNSDSFFDPDFRIRRNGVTSGTLAVAVTPGPVNGTQASGNTSWTHTAGGHVQARLSLPGLVNLDAQLFGYTETTGNSLVFGRELTTQTQLLGIIDAGPLLEGLVNDVTGASVIYDWGATSTVSGLAIAPDQLYRVDFNVTSGSGLPVGLLESMNFSISGAGVTGANNGNTATVLNLLDLVTIGSGSDSENVSFYFTSNQSPTSLDFNFSASSGVGVNLLGGTEGNQNVVTFSGFQVTAVPEPSSLALCGAFVSVLALRRRRLA